MSHADNIYTAFGLLIASEIELPSLHPARLDGGATADVTIRLAPTPAPFGPPSYLGMNVACTSEGLFLEIPDVAAYRISGGRSIDVSPYADADPRTVAEYLLGTCFGGVLHQLGRLPLHANAFVYGGRAFAFAGQSGAGKSTLAAHFQARGFELLTDDLCALTLELDGQVLAWPGIPRIKLWRDAIDRINIPEDALRPLSWTDQKFEIGAQRSAPQGPTPLAAIFDLQREGPERPAGLRQLSGIAAANVIVANTYRRRLIDVQSLAPRYLGQVSHLVAKVNIFELNRHWGVENIPSEILLIEKALKEVIYRQN